MFWSEDLRSRHLAIETGRHSWAPPPEDHEGPGLARPFVSSSGDEDEQAEEQDRPDDVPSGPSRLMAGATADVVPEPGDGRVRAADSLGIADEVEMLVSVLLARDVDPPLAVGIFGDWGSGKSFFMALMQERMAELADLASKRHPGPEPFCRGVRSVRFNAWHYVDADLWSSLAATLFDELARAQGHGKVSRSRLDLGGCLVCGGVAWGASVTCVALMGVLTLPSRREATPADAILAHAHVHR